MITERTGPGDGITKTELKDAAHQTGTKFEDLRQRASEKIEDATNYVRDRGIRGLASDVDDLATKHPFVAVGAGLGIGYLLGRLMRRK